MKEIIGTQQQRVLGLWNINVHYRQSSKRTSNNSRSLFSIDYLGHFLSALIDECYFKIIKYVFSFTDCDGGNPSISSITPFSYSLCAVYLISPR